MSGAAGFIGSRVVRVLLARGFVVDALDDLSTGLHERLPRHPRLVFARGDAGVPDVWRCLLHRCGPSDVVVHLASCVGVARVLRDPDECLRKNVAGFASLARALRRSSSSRRPAVMVASTSEVYAPSRSLLSESSALRSIAERGRYAYAASKLIGERLIDDVAQERVIHVRLFNVVGPGQSAASGMMLPRFVEAARRDQPLTVYGDGEQVRAFAHVDEVAHALVALLGCSTQPAERINVGGRATARVLDVVAALERAVHRRLSVRYVDPRRSLGPSFDEVPYREPDLGRLGALGCPVPAMPLGAIVRDTWLRHPIECAPRVVA